MNKINSRIEFLREKLNKQVDEEGEISNEALILSQELDKALVEYYNKKIKERR